MPTCSSLLHKLHFPVEYILLWYFYTPGYIDSHNAQGGWKEAMQDPFAPLRTSFSFTCALTSTCPVESSKLTISTFPFLAAWWRQVDPSSSFGRSNGKVNTSYLGEVHILCHQPVLQPLPLSLSHLIQQNVAHTGLPGQQPENTQLVDTFIFSDPLLPFREPSSTPKLYLTPLHLLTYIRVFQSVHHNLMCIGHRLMCMGHSRSTGRAWSLQLWSRQALLASKGHWMIQRSSWKWFLDFQLNRKQLPFGHLGDFSIVASATWEQWHH